MRCRYGLEPEDFQQMLADQDYKCFMCYKPHGQTKGTRLHVDHDHNTGRVRKPLCQYCNWIVGVVESQRYSKAIEYVKEHE